MRRRGLFLVTILLGTLLPPFKTATAQNPDGVSAVITSPVEGQQLFGQVTIFGSAAHPSTFGSYTLEYNDLRDPNAPWLLVQPRVQQIVQNGVLGAWNTIVVPDGTYALRLRVFLTDGQIGEFVVTSLRVINSQPTPVPTAAEDTGSAPVPTAGPSPTSPVEQPPSSNPAGNITGLGAADSSENSGESLTSGDTANKTTTRINTNRVRQAFCSGVYLTVGIFGAMLVYVLIRGRLRPYTRRLLWQIQDESAKDR